MSLGRGDSEEVGRARSNDKGGLMSGEDKGVTSVTVSSELAISEVLGRCFRLNDLGRGCRRGDKVDSVLESLAEEVVLLSLLLDDDELRVRNLPGDFVAGSLR